MPPLWLSCLCGPSATKDAPEAANPTAGGNAAGACKPASEASPSSSERLKKAAGSLASRDRDSALSLPSLAGLAQGRASSSKGRGSTGGASAEAVKLEPPQSQYQHQPPLDATSTGPCMDSSGKGGPGPNQGHQHRDEHSGTTWGALGSTDSPQASPIRTTSTGLGLHGMSPNPLDTNMLSSPSCIQDSMLATLLKSAQHGVRPSAEGPMLVPGMQALLTSNGGYRSSGVGFADLMRVGAGGSHHPQAWNPNAHDPWQQPEQRFNSGGPSIPPSWLVEGPPPGISPFAAHISAADLQGLANGSSAGLGSTGDRGAHSQGLPSSSPSTCCPEVTAALPVMCPSLGGASSMGRVGSGSVGPVSARLRQSLVLVAAAASDAGSAKLWSLSPGTHRARSVSQQQQQQQQQAGPGAHLHAPPQRYKTTGLSRKTGGGGGGMEGLDEDLDAHVLAGLILMSTQDCGAGEQGQGHAAAGYGRPSQTNLSTSLLSTGLRWSTSTSNLLYPTPAGPGMGADRRSSSASLGGGSFMLHKGNRQGSGLKTLGRQSSAVEARGASHISAGPLPIHAPASPAAAPGQRHPQQKQMQLQDTQLPLSQVAVKQVVQQQGQDHPHVSLAPSPPTTGESPMSEEGLLDRLVATRFGDLLEPLKSERASTSSRERTPQGPGGHDAPHHSSSSPAAPRPPVPACVVPPDQHQQPQHSSSNPVRSVRRSLFVGADGPCLWDAVRREGVRLQQASQAPAQPTPLQQLLHQEEALYYMDATPGVSSSGTSYFTAPHTGPGEEHHGGSQQRTSTRGGPGTVEQLLPPSQPSSRQPLMAPSQQLLLPDEASPQEGVVWYENPGAQMSPSGPEQPTSVISDVACAAVASGLLPDVPQLKGPEEVECEKLIGRGSFGRVYKGTFRGLLVAVKIIPVPLAGAFLPSPGFPSSSTVNARGSISGTSHAAGLSSSLPRLAHCPSSAFFTALASEQSPAVSHADPPSGSPWACPVDTAATGASGAPGPAPATPSTVLAAAAASAALASRIEAEAALGLCLRHPAIVTTYAAFIHEQHRSATSALSSALPTLGTPGGGRGPPPVALLQAACTSSFARSRNCSVEDLSGLMMLGMGQSNPGSAAVLSPSHAWGGADTSQPQSMTHVPPGAWSTHHSGALPVLPGLGPAVANMTPPASPRGHVGMGPEAVHEVHIVMEYCPLGSLRAALDARRVKPSDLTVLLPLAWDVCCALEYLHGQEVVHGDLKAANVMLCGGPSKDATSSPSRCPSTSFSGASHQSPGTSRTTPAMSQGCTSSSYNRVCAKVADFGHSRIHTQQLGGSPMSGAEPSDQLPTMSHLAPELVGAPAPQCTFASDVYALGVVLWEAATGGRPYHRKRPADLLQSKLVRSTASELPFPDSVPRGYVDLCHACWASDPHARPTAAQAVQRMVALCSELAPSVDLEQAHVMGARASTGSRSSMPWPACSPPGSRASMATGSIACLSISGHGSYVQGSSYASGSQSAFKPASQLARHEEGPEPQQLSMSSTQRVMSLMAGLGDKDVEAALRLGAPSPSAPDSPPSTLALNAAAGAGQGLCGDATTPCISPRIGATPDLLELHPLPSLPVAVFNKTGSANSDMWLGAATATSDTLTSNVSHPSTLSASPSGTHRGASAPVLITREQQDTAAAAAESHARTISCSNETTMSAGPEPLSPWHSSDKPGQATQLLQPPSTPAIKAPVPSQASPLSSPVAPIAPPVAVPVGMLGLPSLPAIATHRTSHGGGVLSGSFIQRPGTAPLQCAPSSPSTPTLPSSSNLPYVNPLACGAPGPQGAAATPGADSSASTCFELTWSGAGSGSSAAAAWVNTRRASMAPYALAASPLGRSMPQAPPLGSIGRRSTGEGPCPWGSGPLPRNTSQSMALAPGPAFGASSSFRERSAPGAGGSSGTLTVQLPSTPMPGVCSPMAVARAVRTLSQRQMEGSSGGGGWVGGMGLSSTEVSGAQTQIPMSLQSPKPSEYYQTEGRLSSLAAAAMAACEGGIGAGSGSGAVPAFAMQGTGSWPQPSAPANPRSATSLSVGDQVQLVLASGMMQRFATFHGDTVPEI